MSPKEDLKSMAERLGVDLFGVAKAEDLNGAPKGHRPKDLVPDAKSVIVLGMKLLDGQVDILPVEEGADFFEDSQRQDLYAGHNDSVAGRVDGAGYQLARELEKKGYKAFLQMASRGGVDRRHLRGLFSNKHAAWKAGLGVFGRHSLIITPRFGPRVRLAAIVTNAELEPDKPLSADYCKTCKAPCIELCPSGALKRAKGDMPYSVDKFVCSQYLGTRPACGICLKVCPVGQGRK